MPRPVHCCVLLFPVPENSAFYFLCPTFCCVFHGVWHVGHQSKHTVDVAISTSLPQFTLARTGRCPERSLPHGVICSLGSIAHSFPLCLSPENGRRLSWGSLAAHFTEEETQAQRHQVTCPNKEMTPHVSLSLCSDRSGGPAPGTALLDIDQVGKA